LRTHIRQCAPHWACSKPGSPWLLILTQKEPDPAQARSSAAIASPADCRFNSPRLRTSGHPPCLSCHAGSVQLGPWHVVLAACGADRKAAAKGMRAIIDESGGAVGWRATGSASWPQQLDLAIAGWRGGALALMPPSTTGFQSVSLCQSYISCARLVSSVGSSDV
jgi:hypothetical protein